MEDSSSSLPSVVSPKEEMEEKHKELVMDMFQKITEYLNGELAGEDSGWCALFRIGCLPSYQ